VHDKARSCLEKNRAVDRIEGQFSVLCPSHQLLTHLPSCCSPLSTDAPRLFLRPRPACITRAQPAEEIEGVNPGAVTVAPPEAQSIPTNGRHLNDPDLPPADHRTGENLQPSLGTLGGATVGTGADLAQIVEGIVAFMAIPPADGEEAPGLFEATLCGIRVEPHSAPPARISRHRLMLMDARIGNFNVAPNDRQSKMLTSPFDRHGWTMVTC